MEKYLTTTEGKKIVCNYPNECPNCHRLIEPIDKCREYDEDNNQVYFLFECPNCGKGFLSYYNINEEIVTHRANSYTKLSYCESYPKIPISKEYDDSIIKMSSSFCDIYNQAYIAEQYNLKEIAGIGYRKALEFLIKDYCILNNKDEIEKIKNENISQVISEYIVSEKIKKLAKASVWIGNDETHYVRKIEDKDISDLKKFIDATLAFIQYELISDEAERLIESKEQK